MLVVIFCIFIVLASSDRYMFIDWRKRTSCQLTGLGRIGIGGKDECKELDMYFFKASYKCNSTDSGMYGCFYYNRTGCAGTSIPVYGLLDSCTPKYTKFSHQMNKSSVLNTLESGTGIGSYSVMLPFATKDLCESASGDPMDYYMYAYPIDTCQWVDPHYVKTTKTSKGFQSDVYESTDSTCSGPKVSLGGTKEYVYGECNLYYWVGGWYYGRIGMISEDQICFDGDHVPWGACTGFNPTTTTTTTTTEKSSEKHCFLVSMFLILFLLSVL